MKLDRNVFFALILTLPAICLASTDFTGMGLWTDATKWSEGIPSYTSEQAIITDGSTCMVDGTITNANCNYLHLGRNGTSTLNVTGGTLDSSNALIMGNLGAAPHGFFYLSTGQVTFNSITAGKTGDADINVTGGSLIVNSNMILGQAADHLTTCEVTLSGGTVSIGGDIKVGDSADANGIVNMNNGDMSIAGSLVIGAAAGSNGTIHLTGGTIDCSDISIGIDGRIVVEYGKIICNGDAKSVFDQAIGDGRITRGNVSNPDLYPVATYHAGTDKTTLELDIIIIDPDIAMNPSPAHDEVELLPDQVQLSWEPSLAGADSHHIYLGTSYYQVSHATDPNVLPGRGSQPETSYTTGPLDKNTLYYWRIDEVRAGQVYKGNVWQFTTQRDFKMFPRGNELAPIMDVVNLAGVDTDTKLAAITLQGQVNSNGSARVYVRRDSSGDDSFWRDWLLTAGHIQGVNEISVSELFGKYSNEYTTAVVYDPDLLSTINVATMIASVNDGIVIHPDHIGTYGLGKTVQDLRGMWTTNVSAYQWAYDNLWDQMNHEVLGCYHPVANSHILRDYLVANQIFHAFVTGESVENPPESDYNMEYAFLEQVFADTNPNIPVMGWWAGGAIDPGLTEAGGNRLAARYGKLMVNTSLSTNLSLLSGTKVSMPSMVKQYKHRQACYPPPLDPSKIYIAFTVVDSGGSPSYWQYRQYEEWSNPARGTVPINWSLGVAATELLPAVIQWYYENAAPEDSFYMAMSGPGYCYPYIDFMKDVQDPAAAWNEYMQITQYYIDLLDFKEMHLFGQVGWDSCFNRAENDPITWKFVNSLTGLETIMIDMARDDCIEPDYNYKLGDVFISHITTRWPSSRTETESYYSQWLAGDIVDHTPPGRPAFMQVQCNSWRYSPSTIKGVMDSLPGDYVAVSPGNLRILYEQGVEGKSPNPADINRDWTVDIKDFTHISNQWTESGGEPSADIFPFTGDGITDSDDLLLFLDNWLWGN